MSLHRRYQGQFPNTVPVRRTDDIHPMNGSESLSDQTPSQLDSHAASRARVLETAEQLFRQYGYHKTTVADIARALSMSPANVYRFYDSKRAIFEAIAIKLLNAVELELLKIAQDGASAEVRLRAFLAKQHQLSTQYFVGDTRIRDMVQVAINERWVSINQHTEAMRRMVERIIRDGVNEGVFESSDPAGDSTCVMAGWLRFCHPLLIAEALFTPGPELEQMAGFLMGALRRTRI